MAPLLYIINQLFYLCTNQGQTVDKAVIDLGRSEATAGLIFVCLSCGKRRVDLLVEPMSFNRLSKLGGKPALKIRLE